LNCGCSPRPGQAEIEQVFEFALDDCQLSVLPPDAGPQAFAALLDERCADDATARDKLRAVWLAQGVDLSEPVAPPIPVVASAASAPGAATVTAAASAASGAPAPGQPPVQAPAVVAAPADERRQRGPDRRHSLGRRGDETRFVKVRADKLDHLIDLIGELVIAGSGAQMVATAEGSPAFLEATQRVAELVQATRDGTLALRMVPVGETFSRFSRVVRDISKQLGKEIELVVTGGDTELDKSMVDVIGDPLMHLVRNSLDHGIETPEERIAAGKAPVGRLGLNAYHEAGSIIIEVSDDGRGLARERILAKATERGLIAEGAVLSDPEVWQLIFAPGFSTADTVTDISGRGVGMDVVKRNIESLRGQIALASTTGRGTTTQVRLPLTLAMIDGFLTLVGGVHYVLPLAVVSECIDLPRECREQPERTCGTFDLRGEVLPYLDLALFYGNGSPPQANPGRRSLVVVRQGAVRIGLVVDRLLGEHQTVIKPLASIFKPLEALAGSTILGSGDVALVLDMQGLMAAALRPGATPSGCPGTKTPTASLKPHVIVSASPVEVRVMNNILRRLQLWQKFAVLGLLALWSVRGSHLEAWYSDRPGPSIAVAQAEDEGLDAVEKPSCPCMRKLQDHRGLSGMVLSGHTTSEANRRAQAAQVEAAMDALPHKQLATAVHQGRRGTHLDAQRVEALSQKVDSRAITPADALPQHSALLEPFGLDLLDQVADVSGLSLDPVGESYYLMTAVIDHLPRLAESLAVARGRRGPCAGGQGPVG
jgi:chemotaxis protein histidine kinase CheA